MFCYEYKKYKNKIFSSTKNTLSPNPKLKSLNQQPNLWFFLLAYFIIGDNYNISISTLTDMSHEYKHRHNKICINTLTR